LFWFGSRVGRIRAVSGIDRHNLPSFHTARRILSRGSIADLETIPAASEGVAVAAHDDPKAGGEAAPRWRRRGWRSQQKKGGASGVGVEAEDVSSI
jgi:hypothetical protein